MYQKLEDQELPGALQYARRKLSEGFPQIAREHAFNTYLNTMLRWDTAEICDEAFSLWKEIVDARLKALGIRLSESGEGSEKSEYKR